MINTLFVRNSKRATVLNGTLLHYYYYYVSNFLIASLSEEAYASLKHFRQFYSASEAVVKNSLAWVKMIWPFQILFVRRNGL